MTAAEDFLDRISGKKYFRRHYPSEPANTSSSANSVGTPLGNPVFDATKAIDMVLSSPSNTPIAEWYLGEMARIKKEHIDDEVKIEKIEPKEATILKEKLDKEFGLTRETIRRLSMIRG